MQYEVKAHYDAPNHHGARDCNCKLIQRSRLNTQHSAAPNGASNNIPLTITIIVFKTIFYPLLPSRTKSTDPKPPSARRFRTVTDLPPTTVARDSLLSPNGSTVKGSMLAF